MNLDIFFFALAGGDHSPSTTFKLQQFQHCHFSRAFFQGCPWKKILSTGEYFFSSSISNNRTLPSTRPG